MTANDVVKLLSVRYKSPEFAFLTQVRNQTGYSVADGIRTADAIAMSLYPSRGMYLHGFEIKVSRSDFLSELAKPDKADAIGKYCHYWWIVAGDGKVAKVEEMPDTWGLLVAEGDRLVAKKQATLMTPQSLSYPFLAGLLRKASEGSIPESMVKEQVEQRVKQIIASKEWTAKHRVQECDKLETKIKDFELRSGIKIDSWSLGDVADAVREIREAKSGSYQRYLIAMKETAERIIEKIDETLKKETSL